MKLGSLFDGIGGFPYSASKFGIESIWASEIEPWPIQVTTKHFPNMEHLGDVTKVNGAEIEPVDIITFGSPCTRLSVAGRHDGFDVSFRCIGNKDNPHSIYKNKIRATDKYTYFYTDTCKICGKELVETNESALFFHAVRIIKEMRGATNGIYPRFAIWENVPGAFSSNRGQDFRAVLESFTENKIPMPVSGGWANAGMVRTERVDIAWRVLDAQYWGVPQRRRRVFLVADFAGRCAAEILFKPESLSRYSSQSQKAGKGPTKNATGSVATAGGSRVTSTVSQCLTSRTGCRYDPETETLIPVLVDQGGSVMSVHNDLSPTLRAEEHGHQPIVMREVSRTLRAEAGAPKHEADWESLIIEPRSQDGVCRIHEKVVPTLNTAQGGQRQPCVMAFTQNQRDEVRDLGNKSGALQAQPGMKQQTYIYGICPDSSNSMKSNNPYSGIYKADSTKTLDLSGGNPACNQGGMAIACPSYSIQGSMIGRADKNGPVGDGINKEVSFTLNTIDRHAVAQPIPINTMTVQGRPSDKGRMGSGIGKPGDPANTISSAHGHAVAVPDTVVTVDCRNLCENEELSVTIQAKENGGQSLNYINPVAYEVDEQLLFENHSQDTRYVGPLDVAPIVSATFGMGGNNQPFVVNKPSYTVRRLTPTECLRLQGFPDWWLDIEGASDTAKYKAIGNSLAIPCVDYIMHNVAFVEKQK